MKIYGENFRKNQNFDENFHVCSRYGKIRIIIHIDFNWSSDGEADPSPPRLEHSSEILVKFKKFSKIVAKLFKNKRIDIIFYSGGGF